MFFIEIRMHLLQWLKIVGGLEVCEMVNIDCSFMTSHKKF